MDKTNNKNIDKDSSTSPFTSSQTLHYEVEEGTINIRGGKAHYYIFTPKTTPRAIVQILHGMCEHIGRYKVLIEELCKNGIICCGIDMRAHGQTGSSVGNVNSKFVNRFWENNSKLNFSPDATFDESRDLGYFGNGVKYSDLFADQEAMRLFIRSRYHYLPYIFYAHSMGSMIARGYAQDFIENAKNGCEILDAMIISSGVYYKSGFKPKLAAFLAAFLASIKGAKHISRKFRNAVFFRFVHGVKSSNIMDFNSADKDINDEFLSDPLCRFSYTVSSYREDLSMLSYINLDSTLYIPQGMQVLLISGGRDPLENNGLGVESFYNSLCDDGFDNIKMKKYENMYHDLLHDHGYEEVITDVISFIENVIDGFVESRKLNIFSIFGSVNDGG